MVNVLRIFFSMKEMKEMKGMKGMKGMKDVQKKCIFARRCEGKEEARYKWQGSFIIHFMFLRGGRVMLEGCLQTGRFFGSDRKSEKSEFQCESASAHQRRRFSMEAEYLRSLYMSIENFKIFKYCLKYSYFNSSKNVFFFASFFPRVARAFAHPNHAQLPFQG